MAGAKTPRFARRNAPAAETTRPPRGRARASVRTIHRSPADGSSLLRGLLLVLVLVLLGLLLGLLFLLLGLLLGLLFLLLDLLLLGTGAEGNEGESGEGGGDRADHVLLPW